MTPFEAFAADRWADGMPSSSTAHDTSSPSPESTIVLPAPVAVVSPCLHNPSSSVAPCLHDNDDERLCRFCNSKTPLLVDWSQGDCVCTNCGVVHDERLLDDRPEWREFGDYADDNNAPSAKARSGLVLVDETKYLGGLQPTILSKQLFGGGGGGVGMLSGSSSRNSLKRLAAVNRKLDKNMERMHAKAIESVHLSRRLKRKKLDQDSGRQGQVSARLGVNDDDEDTYDEDADAVARPELEQMVLQEEEAEHRLHSSLYADKWSLDRAIQLYGGESGSSSTTNKEGEGGQHLDNTLLQASSDLYQAYTMLLATARALCFPDRVINESAALLTRYAARRDGLIVRGVSSNMVQPNTTKQPLSIKSSPDTLKRTREAFRQYNKLKQSAALSATILFCTSRNLQQPRSLVECRQAVQKPLREQLRQTVSSESCNEQLLTELDLNNESSNLIKMKHCSRAMSDLKEAFPQLAKPSTVPIIAAASSLHRTEVSLQKEQQLQQEDSKVASFTEHCIRKLGLPPVAEASIRMLAIYYQSHFSKTASTGKKQPAIVGGALALFVCHTGQVMQRLACQAEKKRRQETSTSSLPLFRTKLPPVANNDSKGSNQDVVPLQFTTSDESRPTLNNGKRLDFSMPESISIVQGLLELNDDTDNAEAVSKEQRAYEMSRVWDAWTEQTPWSRSLTEIEQSCGSRAVVSSHSILEYYRKHLYPERLVLLNALKDSVAVTATKSSSAVSLKDTPLASVLLPHIALASPLLKATGKLERM